MNNRRKVSMEGKYRFVTVTFVTLRNEMARPTRSETGLNG